MDGQVRGNEIVGHLEGASRKDKQLPLSVLASLRSGAPFEHESRNELAPGYTGGRICRLSKVN